MYSLIKVFHAQFCAISRITITHSITHSDSQNAKSMKRLNLYWLLSINTKINTSAINISAKWHCRLVHNLRKRKCSGSVLGDFGHTSEELHWQKFLIIFFYIKVEGHSNFPPKFKSLSFTPMTGISTSNLLLSEFIKL